MPDIEKPLVGIDWPERWHGHDLRPIERADDGTREEGPGKPGWFYCELNDDDEEYSGWQEF
jgi:hypothetical protein